MSVALAETARAELAAWTAYDEPQDALRDRMLKVLADPAAVTRDRFPEHLTAGVVVLSIDREQVLLNLHRKAGIWVHFGGHAEAGDDSLRAAATREGREECGLALPEITEQPVQLSVHEVGFCHPRGPVDHLDVRYAAYVDPLPPVVSEESLQVRWWPVDDLPTDAPDMIALIERARAY